MWWKGVSCLSQKCTQTFKLISCTWMVSYLFNSKMCFNPCQIMLISFLQKILFSSCFMVLRINQYVTCLEDVGKFI